MAYIPGPWRKLSGKAAEKGFSMKSNEFIKSLDTPKTLC